MKLNTVDKNTDDDDKFLVKEKIAVMIFAHLMFSISKRI
jgi:hypothetical protein